MRSSPIEKWFYERTEGLARSLGKQFDITGPRYDLIIWHIFDSAIPPFYHEFLGTMGIRYITVRSGCEVNYLVFLDQNFNKFAEREIYWEGA